jgi:hypothetical protein
MRALISHDAPVSEAAEQIPDHVRRAGMSAARRTAISAWALCVALSVVGVVVVFVIPPNLGFVIATPPLTLAGGAGFVAYRHGSARRLIDSRPGVPVRYERWTRAPDGSNVAVFGRTAESSAPIAVVRLPTKKSPRVGEGWYFEQTHATAAAVVDTSGELIAAGWLPADGRFRWNRRNEAPPAHLGGWHPVHALIRAARRRKSESDGSTSQD